MSQPFGFSLANSGNKSVVASQTVSFSVSGLPSGATGSFSSTSCTPACSTVLNISTGGSTPAGNFPITITQTGGGVTRTTAFTLIVTLASTVAAPTITSGATYWVAKTGSDSNSCSQAQSQSTPRLTINEGLKCLAGGNTLYILPGTYNEKIESRAGTPSVPSGRSWTNMTTISAAPGSELKVILRPDSADHVVYLLGTHRYINFNGLVLDGSNTSYTGTKAVMCSPGDHNCGTIGGLPQFIKWSNSEIKNSHDSGVLGYNDSIFTNMNIHHNGSTHFDHGLYITGVGNLIQNSHVYHNSGYGVHVYNQPGGVHNNTVRGNVIYSNGQSKRGTGIVLSSGFNNQAFNNIIYDNLGGGIQIDWGDNAKAYNNTIYNNPAGCIFIGGSSSNAIVKNNLCSDSGGITNAGTRTIQSNNLTTNR